MDMLHEIYNIINDCHENDMDNCMNKIVHDVNSLPVKMGIINNY